MKSIILPHFSLVILLTMISCQESTPRSKMRSIQNTRESAATGDATKQSDVNKSSSVQNNNQTDSTGTDTSGANNIANSNADNKNNADNNNVADTNQTTNQQDQAAALAPRGIDLRWMSIGEKPNSTLSAVAVCPLAENVNRAVCTSRNTLCKSSGTVG